MNRTQCDRVLAKAKSYDGVAQVDFLLPDVCDGGPPITRVAARLYDLDMAGHSFEAIGHRNRCKVFRWVSGPESEAGPPAPLAPAASLALSTRPTEDRLFEVGRPEMGAYDYDLHGEAA